MQAKGALRILVVEDDADTGDCMAVLLRLYGDEVAVARDGPAALRIVAEDGLDVVLIDIAMPKMDGWRLAKEIRGRNDAKRLLLIAVSGYGAASDRVSSQEAGIDVHLIKPVKVEVLEDLFAAYRHTV